MTNFMYNAITKTNCKGTLKGLEEKLYEFLTAKEFLQTVKVGDSYSEKKLKKQFIVLNDKKKSVDVSTIVNVKNAREVCKFIVNQFIDKKLELSCIPTVNYNDEHHNFSIDFVSADGIDKIYSKKELTVKDKINVNPTEFIIKYIKKNEEIIDFEFLKSFISDY